MATISSEFQRRAVTRILFCPAEERTARELQELPREDREQVWADMTGDPEATYYRIHHESPEFLSLSLNAVTKNLEGYHHPSRASFDRAFQQDCDYVNSQRLKFLRAENFDPAAAASRMIAFFQIKEDLFGADKLSRDILLRDLSADDLESLRAGGIVSALHLYYVETSNWLVSVSYQVGGYPEGGYDFEMTRKVSTLVRCFPLRFSAIYVCYSASPWKIVADLISHLLSPFLRVRLRSVQGSHQECLYNLMALGVPHHIIPVSPQGEELFENHLKWIEERERSEAGLQ
eukprot:scaffold22560_cov135-Cylindrotheca_fusiformis.AAC.60